MGKIREIALRKTCGKHGDEGREKPVGAYTQPIHSMRGKDDQTTRSNGQPTRYAHFLPHFSTGSYTRKNAYRPLENRHLYPLSTPPTITTTIFI